MFIAKSVLFNFFALFLDSFDLLSFQIKSFGLSAHFLDTTPVTGFFSLMLNGPHDQSALLSTEP